MFTHTTDKDVLQEIVSLLYSATSQNNGIIYESDANTVISKTLTNTFSWRSFILYLILSLVGYIVVVFCTMDMLQDQALGLISIVQANPDLYYDALQEAYTKLIPDVF